MSQTNNGEIVTIYEYWQKDPPLYGWGYTPEEAIANAKPLPAPQSAGICQPDGEGGWLFHCDNCQHQNKK